MITSQNLHKVTLLSLILIQLLVGCQSNTQGLISSTPKSPNEIPPVTTTPIPPTITTAYTSEKTETPIVKIEPSDTPTIAPKETLENPTLGDSVVIISRSQDQINIFDGELKLITSFPDSYSYLFWSESKQSLIELTPWQFSEISEISLDGLVVETRRLLTTETEDNTTFYLSLSPDQKWISYLLSSGELGRSLADAEFRDVKLVQVSFDYPSEPILLSNFGVARPGAVSWSPDSRFLAFSDRDEVNQISQIYIYDVESGQKLQLTNFGSETPFLEVLMLSWSHDSNYLAFEVADQIHDGYNNWLENEQIGVLSLETSETTWIDLGIQDTSFWLGSIHWQAKTPVMIILLGMNNDDNKMIWYDAGLKQVIREEKFVSKDPIYETKSPVNEAFPFEEVRRVLCIGSDFFLIFDEVTGKFTRIPNDTAITTPEIIIAQIYGQ